jgi:polysaccharide deacetylase family sporulation protein PdaB
VLPPTKKYATTITVVLLGLALFFLCSWTLAASIVGNRATSDETLANPLPAESVITQPVDTEASPPDPSQETPPADVPSDGTDKEITAEISPPAGPTQSPIKAEYQPIFPPEPYSLEVLRGQNGTDKRIALTFDDGPDPHWTTQYLAVLKEKQVPATFFFIGNLIAKHPQIVQAAIADDHEVGVHSHTHSKLTSLKEAQIRQDLVDAAHTLYNVTQQTVVYFRPPYGATNSTVNNIAHGLGQTVVTWNVDPRDWATTDSNQIVNQVLRQVQAGSIILLHEGKAQTLQALPTIIQRLRQEGYEFVTVSELFSFRPSESIPVSTAPTADSVPAPAVPADEAKPNAPASEATGSTKIEPAPVPLEAATPTDGIEPTTNP